MHRRIIYGSIFLFLIESTAISCGLHAANHIFYTDHELKKSFEARYCFSGYLLNYYTVQFMLVGFFIQSRFNAINEQLSQTVAKSVFKTFEAKMFIMSQIRNSFHKLCDVIDIMNETFTFHISILFFNYMVKQQVLKLKALICLKFILASKCFWLLWHRQRAFEAIPTLYCYYFCERHGCVSSRIVSCNYVLSWKSDNEDSSKNSCNYEPTHG